MEDMNKQRVIQEYVPGKQVTLAHLIANPAPDLLVKLGSSNASQNAVGIMTITPSEAAIIAADIATKAANVDIIFIDRFSGALVFSGDVASVESALREAVSVLETEMTFTSTKITIT